MERDIQNLTKLAALLARWILLRFKHQFLLPILAARSVQLTYIQKSFIIFLKQGDEANVICPTTVSSDARFAVQKLTNGLADTTFYQSIHQSSQFNFSLDIMKKLGCAYTRSLKKFTERGSVALEINPNQQRHDVRHNAILNRRWDKCDWIGMAKTNQDMQAFKEGMRNFTRIHGGPPMVGSTLTVNLVVLLFWSGPWAFA